MAFVYHLVANMVVPGVGTVKKTLATILQLCDDMRECEEPSRRVHSRLVDVFTALQTMSNQRLSSTESLCAYTQLLGKSVAFVQRNHSRPLYRRVLEQHKTMEELRELHQDVDTVVRDLELALSATEWQQQWQDDCVAQTCQLRAVIADYECVKREVLDANAQVEAMAVLKFTLNKHQEQDADSDDEETTLMLEMIKTLLAQIVRVSSLAEPTVPLWFVPPGDVKLDGTTPFAHSFFGDWYHGTLASDGTKVVVHKLHFDPYAVPEATLRMQLENEINALFALSHVHIVKMRGACHVTSPPLIVYHVEDTGVAQGNLMTVLSSIKSHQRMWRYLYQVARGLEYLHENGIVHGNLTLESILVGADDTVRVADFGWSFAPAVATTTTTTGLSASRSQASVLRWRAPECLAHRPTFAADVYALGMCILAAVTREPPFAHVDDATVYCLVRGGKIPPRPDQLAADDTAWELVQEMTSSDPSLRPSMATVVFILEAFVTREDADASKRVAVGEAHEEDDQASPNIRVEAVDSENTGDFAIVEPGLKENPVELVVEATADRSSEVYADQKPVEAVYNDGGDETSSSAALPSTSLDERSDEVVDTCDIMELHAQRPAEMDTEPPTSHQTHVEIADAGDMAPLVLKPPGQHSTDESLLSVQSSGLAAEVGAVVALFISAGLAKVVEACHTPSVGHINNVDEAQKKVMDAAKPSVDVNPPITACGDDYEVKCEPMADKNVAVKDIQTVESTTTGEQDDDQYSDDEYESYDTVNDECGIHSPADIADAEVESAEKEAIALQTDPVLIEHKEASDCTHTTGKLTCAAVVQAHESKSQQKQDDLRDATLTTPEASSDSTGADQSGVMNSRLDAATDEPPNGAVRQNSTVAVALGSLAVKDEPIAGAGGVARLIRLLNGTDEERQERAARALRHLVAVVDHHDAIIHAGGIASLIQLLRHGTDQATAIAVDVLVSLASNAATHNAFAEAGGGVQTLIEFVREGDDGKAAKEKAARALGRLAGSSVVVSEMIVDAGGVASLLVLNHDGNDTQRATAASALVKVAPELHVHGNMEHLVAMVREGNPAQKNEAAWALMRLTESETNRVAIVHAGAIAPLVQLLQHDTSGDCKQRLCVVSALACLSENAADSVVVLIAEAGGIPLLVELLKDASELLRTKALQVLANLAQNDVNRVKIVEAGGVAPLIEIVRVGGNAEEEHWAATALALLVKDAVVRRAVREMGGMRALQKLASSGSLEQAEVHRALWKSTRCVTIYEVAHVPFIVVRQDASEASRQRYPWMALSHSAHLQDATFSRQFTSEPQASSPSLKEPPATMATIVLDLLVPGAGSVLEVLGAIYSLCCEMKESQETCVRVHGRLQDIFTELQKMEESKTLPPSESLGRYTQTLATYMAYLTKYRTQPLYSRFLNHKTMIGELAAIHEEIDMVMTLLHLATTSAMMQWRQQYDQDNAAIYALLVQLASNGEQVLSEVRDTNGQMKALTLLQYEINRQQGDQSKAMSAQSQQGDELMRMMKQMYAKFVAVSKGAVPTVPTWFVPEVDVTYDPKPFARGSFGAVHRGTWKGADVVVKTLLMDQATITESEKTQFLKEIDIWSTLNYPHVIKMFRACHNASPPFIVCEVAANGDLESYLRRFTKTTTRAPYRHLWRLLHEAALGLAYMHDNDLVHGDLKLNNILVGSDGRALVADFGLSFAHAPGGDATSAPSSSGGLRWHAPECVHQKPTAASDVYSLAMCILEAVTGEPPFGMMDDAAVAKRLRDGQIQPRPDGIADDAWALVESMTKHDASQRRPLREVVTVLKNLAVAQKAEAGAQEEIEDPAVDFIRGPEPVSPSKAGAAAIGVESIALSMSLTAETSIVDLVTALRTGTTGDKLQAIKFLYRICANSSNTTACQAIKDAGGYRVLDHCARDAGAVFGLQVYAVGVQYRMSLCDGTRLTIAQDFVRGPDAATLARLLEAVSSTGREDSKVVEATEQLACLAISHPQFRDTLRDAGVIPKLVTALRIGTEEQVAEATFAIGTLAMLSPANQAMVIESGAIPLLTGQLHQNELLVDHTLFTMNVLAPHESAGHAVAAAGAIVPLVQLLRTGSETQKSTSASVLANLTGMLKPNNVRAAIVQGGAIAPLVAILQNSNSTSSSSGSDVQRVNAIRALGTLTLYNGGAVTTIAQAGGFVAIIALLGKGSEQQRHAATLAIVRFGQHDPGSCAAMVQAGAIASLVEATCNGSPSQKELAATALSVLAFNNGEIATSIAQAGAIPALVALVRPGTTDAEKEAATRTLGVLTWNNDNIRVAIAQAGVIPLIVQLLRSTTTDAARECAVSALDCLASGSVMSIRLTMVDAGVIPVLVPFLPSGSDQLKTSATRTLSSLAFSNVAACVAITQAGALVPLVQLLRSSDDAQKASAACTLGQVAFCYDASRAAMDQAGAVPPLLELVRSGSADQKKFAVFALGALMKNPAVCASVKAQGGVNELKTLERAGSGDQAKLAHDALAEARQREAVQFAKKAVAVALCCVIS